MTDVGRSTAAHAEGDADTHAMLAQLAFYVVHGAGLCKIGCSVDISKRLSQHRSSSPVPLTLTRAIICHGPRGTESHVEKCLHSAFWDKRCHGEWYALDETDLTYLDQSCQPWLAKYAVPEQAYD